MSFEPPTQPLPPEEALRRHAEGDRSPAVLHALSNAAWEAFHAPWEPHLEETPMKDETPELPLPEGGIRPLTLDMIQAWTEHDGCSAFRHPTRGFLIDYKFGLRSDRCVQLRLYVTGKNADILGLQWTCDKRIPPDQFVRGLRLCNWWNNEFRWPRAMVEQDYRFTDANQDPPPPKEEVEAREGIHSSHLFLDLATHLPHGIHQEGLNAIIDSAVESSWNFWRRAHEDWSL
jgi:hypothetical protein